MSSLLGKCFKSLVRNAGNVRSVALQKRSLPSWGPPTPVVDRKDIEFRVFRALSKHDKVDIKSISVDTHFGKDLGLDSLDLIECVVELEDEFKVEVGDEDVDRMMTVSAVVDWLVKYYESRVDQNRRPDIEFGEFMTQGRPVN